MGLIQAQGGEHDVALVPTLTTSRTGRLKFAALSETALGAPSAREGELRRWYHHLSRSGVSTALKIGSTGNPSAPVIDPVGIDLGVMTWELGPQATIPVVHGRDGAGVAIVIGDYDPAHPLRLERRLRAHHRTNTILLIGGHRKFDSAYDALTDSYAISTGVFSAMAGRPSADFGGVVIELVFDKHGYSLEAQFSDYSRYTNEKWRKLNGRS